ncbi:MULTISPECIES: histidine phosphatase family protein [Micromonospora]|uniref:Histidine phosphatase family protein n=1 Tax=Micromonospora solifontis TaxID=2487138 RepID=A0ABX9WE20_9ACTN|nr:MULTISPECIES: histidine phosphatase family protein [Micromonospora]NES16708.1 histidine phosphatase family protein [Micromonospora sp. PPF5-17B]NES37724.1 histidine phosphatase family protein [Micromonospora solifontis]NES58462.1 histidine phosphatase family protein [Micromonospora sp. PPF5-6]RNL98068.1 histidine phosphatase family protein [Micromonospora solifontis]
MASRLLFLARHGEQDRADEESPAVGLSERGRRQATLLGERLRDARIDAVHHGPLPRAAETAALVAAALPGVPVHVSDDVGDHLPHDTDPAGLPPAYADLLAAYDAAERAEGPRRTAAAVDRFATAPADGDVRELVVTHSFLIAWLVRHALDAPDRRWLGLNPHNAGLTVIRYSSGRPPSLIAVNDVAHLPPELRGTGLPADYRF